MAQESEGTVIIVVPDPAEVQDLATGEVALQYCPQGVWVCFDDCKVAPLAGELESKINSSACEALRRLIALRPSSTKGPDDKINNVHERLAFVPAVTRTFFSRDRWQEMDNSAATNSSNIGFGPDNSIIAGEDISRRSTCRHG